MDCKDLKQGSQTRDPRAACGPPKVLVRPDKISNFDNSNTKNDQIVWPNFVLNMAFFSILWPAEPFLFKTAIAEAFSIQIWLLDGLEFETPDLKLIPKKLLSKQPTHDTDHLFC
jgi:hypothetical protein